jgi:signal transduction histidine kinase
LEEASRNIRAFNYLFAPDWFQTDATASAVRALIEGFGKRTGIAMHVKVAASVAEMSCAVQGSILAMVREALIRVHRQCGIRHVWIDLGRMGKRVRLQIADDGNTRTSGHNAALLDMIRERANQLRGRLAVRESVGCTTIEITLPLDAPAPRDPYPAVQTGRHSTVSRRV